MSNNTRNYEAHLGLSCSKRKVLQLRYPTFNQLHLKILEYKPFISWWGIVGYDNLNKNQKEVISILWRIIL